MTDETQGDLALFNNRTHGEIFAENGQPRMEKGLLTAVFISLFSGASGLWWANLLENDEDAQYGGEFEPLAEALDATAQNALLLEEAMKNDLEWMKNKLIASSIEVSSSIKNGDEIFFELTITKPNEEPEILRFSQNWAGQFGNPSDVGIE